MSGIGARAAVFGAAGAIGGALVQALRAHGADCVYALSRHAIPANATGVVPVFADILDEASLAAAAAQIGAHGELDTVMVATGQLHAPGIMPEKALREIAPEAMATIFAVNCTGPALAMKHFLPLLPRGRPGRLAVLSARVGSISDNRKGGWYAYRAAKAGLNMVVRSAAIETARRTPEAMVVALHPGTVDSALSFPFRGFIAPDQMLAPQVAAERLVGVIKCLRPEQNGQLIAYDGRVIPP